MSDMKFGKSGLYPASITAILCAVLLSGCSSTPVSEVTPISTTPVVVYGTADDQMTDTAPTGGPRKTGTYPTFGKPLRAATHQMTADEVASMRTSMEAIAAARAAGQISEAEYQAKLAEMQKLAAEHGADAKREIEN